MRCGLRRANYTLNIQKCQNCQAELFSIIHISNPHLLTVVLIMIDFSIAELDPSQLTFSSKQPPKKKRKSRTAFTNHQIFELEKRFLYQKYLSPADRDEIAAQLGLSNAQVSFSQN